MKDRRNSVHDELHAEFNVPDTASIFLGAPFVPYWRLYLAQWDVARRALVVVDDDARIFALDSSATRVQAELEEASTEQLQRSHRLSGAMMVTFPGGERIVVRNRPEIRRLQAVLDAWRSGS